jgi:hypothetical protein
MSGRSSFQAAAHAALAQAHVAPSLAALADPANRQIDAAAMDYFLIEMVNTLRASSAVATARNRKLESEMIEAGLLPAPAPAPPAKKETARDSTTSLNLRQGAKPATPAEEEEEALRSRLEGIGIHVGANYTERCVVGSLGSCVY